MDLGALAHTQVGPVRRAHAVDLVQSPHVIQHLPADDAARPGAGSRSPALGAAPPEVFRISAPLNVGGPARRCLLLSEGLRAHGIEALLLTGDLDQGEVGAGIEPSLRPAS